MDRREHPDGSSGWFRRGGGGAGGELTVLMKSGCGEMQSSWNALSKDPGNQYLGH